MPVPKHIWRVPTKEAIEALATRFGLRNDSVMQDWEIEVADHTRLDEFLAAYEGGGLSDDEKFVLMQTIIESFEDSARRGGDLVSDPRWQRTLGVLERNLSLHAYSIWYWSCPDAESQDQLFYASPFIREIMAKHRDYFSGKGSSG